MSEADQHEEEPSAAEPLLFSELEQTNVMEEEEEEEEEKVNRSSSLSEVEINLEKTHEQLESDAVLIDTIEGSEEEIQKQQIANIYRLLNDQNLINSWTTTDFLDQLKMYGLQGYEENDELDSSQTSIE